MSQRLAMKCEMGPRGIEMMPRATREGAGRRRPPGCEMNCPGGTVDASDEAQQFHDARNMIEMQKGRSADKIAALLAGAWVGKFNPN